MKKHYYKRNHIYLCLDLHKGYIRKPKDLSLIHIFTISRNEKRTPNLFSISVISTILVSESHPSTSWAGTALRHGKPTVSTGDGKLIQPPYRSGDLVIDFDKRLVMLKDKEIHLTQIEYKLVSLLAEQSGKVLTYDYIISRIWGPYADSNNQILRVNMAHIRRKLELNPAEPQYIYTEIGVGYRMRESET